MRGYKKLDWIILAIITFFLNAAGLLHGQCTLICNNNVSISADSTCSLRITAAMILNETNPAICSPSAPSDYEVTVMLGPNGQVFPGSPFVGRAYLNQLLYARIRHIPSGNICVGTFRVVSLGSPLIVCPRDTTILCGTPTDTSKLGKATTLECNTHTISFEDKYENRVNACSDTLVGVINRTWTITLANGQKNSCVQVIKIKRPSVAGITFPANRDNVSGRRGVSCVTPNVTPDSTGWPQLNGFNITPTNICGISLSFKDQTINGCNPTYTLLRNWTAVDGCTNAIRTFQQVIQLIDTIKPRLTCISDTLVAFTSSSTQCGATVTVPPIALTDSCAANNQLRVVIMSNFGVINGNGGQLTGVTPGVHTIMYMVSDPCGNTSICNRVVRVIDNTPPVLVCPSSIQVSLTLTGEAQVDPTSFYLQASDLCCTNLTFKLQKMQASPLPFSDSLKYFCAEILTNNMATLEVTDCYGNKNFCMVEVDVVDKLPRTIICPDTVRLLNPAFIADTSVVRAPRVNGTCNLFQLAYEDDRNLGCGSGTGIIKRDWTVYYGGFDTTTCPTQVIIVSDTTLLRATFPPNYSQTNCTNLASLRPDSLPLIYRRPTVINPAFKGIVITHNDVVNYNVSGACIQISRTWTITDTCVYEAGGPIGPANGRIVSTQLIRVFDNTPPSFICPSEGLVIYLDPDSCNTTIRLPVPTNIQECLPDLVTISVSGDFGNSLNISRIPAGIYNVTYRVTDVCGNFGTCDATFAIIENTPPDLFCSNIVSRSLAANGQAIVNAREFIDTVRTVDNCTAKDSIRYRIGARPTPGFTGPPPNASLTFACDDVGDNPLTVWAVDIAGNYERCDVIVRINDPQAVCGGGFTVAGAIKLENGSGVPTVKVEEMKNHSGESMTDNKGIYSLSNLLPGGNYEVMPGKGGSYTDGVTTLDLILVNRHLTGSKALESPYKIIAADVDRNGRISVRDIIQLQRLILNITNTFPENKPWRFVPKSFQFPNPKDPFAAPFPESKAVSNLFGDMMDGDFVAIKVGDVNNSIIPENGISPRSQETSRVLSLPQWKLQPGERVWLPIHFEDRDLWWGGQFALQFNPEFIKIHGFSGAENLNMVNKPISDHVWAVSWYVDHLKKSEAGEVLGFIEVEALRKTNLSDALFVKQNIFDSEAYLSTQSIDSVVVAPLTIQYASPNAATNSGLRLWPNPFKDWVTFQLPPASGEKGILDIYDVQGRKIWTKSWDLHKGDATLFTLQATELPHAGIYIYKYSDGFGQYTGNLMLLK
jgi:hypothetical protein